MNTDTPIAAFSLMQKFQAFYEQFTEFSHEAAELHENLALQDEASRAVFTSLSRIMAFNDQMSILVSLMREDTRVIDELTSEQVTASWSEQIDRQFYDLLRASKTAASNVN
jgi:Mg2+ and Co2+ transporter CorA